MRRILFTFRKFLNRKQNTLQRVSPTSNTISQVLSIYHSILKKMSIIPNTNPFENSLSLATTLSGENPAFLNSQIDWKETPEAHIFKADMTGLKKEEVKVEVEEGRVLQIRGERSVKKEVKNDSCHRVECSSGRFMRSFTLPANAKMDQVKASVENGVLTVTVPKEDVKKTIENSN